MRRKKSPTTVPLAQIVRVRGRFHRSVQLSLDWGAQHDPRDYLATPALIEIADQILGELGQTGGGRAWTLTGPYGTGKSAFALFLTDMLATDQPEHPHACELRERYLDGTKPLRPMLVQAERAPLLPQILTALLDSGMANRTIRDRARRMLKADDTSGASVSKLLSDAADKSPGGLLLIVDELGKYLEFAAREPGEDVFLLQQLAEAAARSEKPLLFIGILHSGFGDYVTEGGTARRTEWQKVQGRFRDIPFSMPSEQFLDLVGRAVEMEPDVGVRRAYGRRFKGIADREAMRDALAQPGLAARLKACLPIHPVTALVLWPLFRSKVAQNERSLFAFLTSYEPHGFQEFAAKQTASGSHAPLFGLPALYDYVSTALGMAVLTGLDSRQWSLIGHALDRVPASAPPLARDLIKGIGLLSLYGGAADLRPDRELLHAVFDENDPTDVNDVLALLEDESIIVFRRHNRAFGLWEGSDIDLDAAFETARGQRSGEPLHQRLLRTGHPRPLVARAHYVQTGTLRFFEPRLAAADLDSVNRALEEPTHADGLVLFLVDPSLDATALDDRICELGGALDTVHPVVTAVPQDPDRLEEALDELECWEWVRETQLELEGDPVARQEVVARIASARSRFEHTAGRTLGLLGHILDPAASRWFFRGQPCTPHPGRPRELQALLTKVCNEAYAKAPPLHNELLNRHELSSAAAKARRNLLERMVHDSESERLGIKGFPPEYSMYEALLVGGGFHRRSRDDSFGLQAPTTDGNQSSWHPVWCEVERFLEDARDRQRPLVELFELLKAPPFGLREGPLPVLFTALLQIKGEEVALYEDGLFVPDTGIETLERLVRRPSTFALRCYRLDADERKAIEALDDLVQASGKGFERATGPAGNLIAIVRQLVRTVEDLPPYVRHTRRGLSPSACAVRDLLRMARDPLSLLLDDMPQALGVALDGTDEPSAYAHALNTSILEIMRAYPNLLDTVEEQVREAFGVEAAGDDLREALRWRTLPLLEYAGDTKLRIFLKETTREVGSNGHDWREGLARAALGGKPPTHWRDEDLDACATQFRILATECDVLSELVATAGNDTATTVASIGILEPGTGKRRAVIACSGGKRAPVADLTRELREAVDRSGLDARSQLMALALAARDLLPADGETEAEKVRESIE